MPADSVDETRAPVVLVDDDDAVRDSIRTMLDVEGIACSAFRSGAALLERLDGLGTACLVLEYNMSDMNGIQLLASLRQRGVKAPALMISGQVTPALIGSARAAGFAAVLEKPLLGAGLMEFVHASVGAHARRARSAAS